MLGLAVGPVDRDAAVGVQDDPPAPPVNADVMMKLTQGYAGFDAGLAAIASMFYMVHVAPGGGASAAGPGALIAVAPQDRAADRRRDAVGVALVRFLHP